MNKSTAVPQHGLSHLGIGLLFFLLGCTSGPLLRPSTDAEIKDRGPTAEAASVVVSAQTGEWEGVPRDVEGYAPMHIHIENNGDQPVRVRYSDFRLAVGDSSISPVDPRSIEGTSHTAARTRGYAGGGGYTSQNFRVASHHSGLHSIGHGPPGHGGHGFRHRFGYGFGHGLGYGLGRGFGHGFGYGSRYGGYGYGGYPSRAVELPSRDMLLTAVPEGVLKPGGTVEGFFYFPLEDRPQAEDETETSVPLDVTIIHSGTGEALGRLSIPFAYRP